MVVFGSLIEKTEPEGTLTSEKTSFLGMGFGYQIPLDILTLFLAGLETKRYSLLLVDEFHRFNREDEKNIQYNLKQIRKCLGILGSIYEFRPEIIVSSDFMGTSEYNQILKEIEEKIKEKKLEYKLIETVPQRHKESENPAIYAINEIACVEFLRRLNGMDLKIGPSKEKIYDSIIMDLGLEMDFAYVIDAYALGSREPEQVIHYIPTSRGRTNGQRLFFDDSIDIANKKLSMAQREASRYLLRVASVAGKRLNKEYLTAEEIEKLVNDLHKKEKLKKITRHLVLENILIPYQEADKNDN